MASVNIHCPRCQSAQVYRHGQNPKGHDRFRCRDCHRVFQLTYTYEACKPGIKDTKTGGVLAYTFGPRTDETCRELLALLTPFNIGMITSER
ncbi:Transposase [Shigella dysenteriae 1617]|uniref:Transposase n=1 Tax=Shigella dysenteriae 1617 TaxID=754093 RepID=A0A0A6ZS55_SHIDY|nr:Transposase [Shigella dysenteriae 1617]